MTSRTLALLVAVLVTGCAHMEPPSGGPVDTKAPAVTAVYPAPGSRNVPLDAPVVIQFSEWIDRNAARNQAFVSPPTRGRLRVVAEGNKLQVQPSEAAGGWRPNTSYQVTVLPTLPDLHGVRAGRTFTLRFSTGAGIDSASLSGKAFSSAPGTRVAALYRVGDRTGVEPLSARATDFRPAPVPEPWRELPAFIALADTSGAFRFDSVAQGDYALFAFDDVNGNFAFDFGFENAAAGPLSIALRPRAPEQVLRTAPVDTLPLRISKVAYAGDSLAGSVRVDFSRDPHPVRAAEAARYRVIPDSGAPIPVLSAAWSPFDEAWMLETPPLRAGGDYRVEMRDRPDFNGRSGAGLPDTSVSFSVTPDRDTLAWRLSLAQEPTQTSLPRLLGAAASGRDFTVASSRPLSPARFKLLNDKLEAWIDSATAPATLSRINNFTFSLKLQKSAPGGKRIDLKLRPGPGDTVPKGLGSLEILDSTRVGTVRFAPPARWLGWTFRLDGEDNASYRIPGATSASGPLVTPTLPIGRYRLFAFRDEDGDGVWNPGAIKPWIPQEPQALVLDSVMVKPGPATDATGALK